MNAQTLKYLQKDEIGKVIATGLAELYMNKPSKPVKYLAEWLKQYSNNQKQMNRLLNSEKQKTHVVKAYETMERANAAREQQKIVKQQNQKKEIDDFKKMITEHQYHQDLLLEIFPQFIEKTIDSTGVYIAELNHPAKQVKQEDTDQLAHLDTAAEKVLNYFGSSVSHQQLMRGKTLKTTQGVTANSFSLLEQVPAPVVGEDGKQIPQPPKPKYVFVPNVVKNESVHYFRIPKLGSYLAVPVICNEYLSEANFDSALKQKQQYIKQCQELEAAKKTDLEQFNKQKEEIEKKINDLVEKNAQESQLEPLKAELKQVQDSILQREKQTIQEKQTQLVGEKKKYVVCTDTLGKDRILTQSQISFVTEIVEHLRESWQNKQKSLIKKDIDLHIQALRQLSESQQNHKQLLASSVQLNQQQQKQVSSITEQNKKNHQQLKYELAKLKSFIKQNDQFLKSFLNLAKYRVLKYRSLLQNLLFFIGLKKQEINEKGKTVLNWRTVKDLYVNERIFNQVLEFQALGPKQKDTVSYSKTPYLAQIFDKFDEEEIFKYNVGLGALLQFVKKALELRELDVEIRKLKFQADKKQLTRVLEQNQKINAKLIEQLEKHKGALSAEDAEKFNEQQWKTQFYSKQPLLPVPHEPVEDKDNDM